MDGEAVKHVGIDEIPVTGYDVEIRSTNDRFSGELLAVDANTIWIATGASRAVRATPRNSVNRVALHVHASHAGLDAFLGGMGTLSTLSHGWWLIFSAPAWLLTTLFTATDLAYESWRDVPASNLDLLHEYARFPQGLPDSWRTPGDS